MTTIFLVDDSATMLASMRGTLELSGFTVETASDGLQAWQRLQAGLKPDLMITDINMPGMDGVELIKKARSKLRFTPILALTTETQQSRREEAREHGATGWLTKPVGGSELVKLIQQVLAQHA